MIFLLWPQQNINVWHYDHFVLFFHLIFILKSMIPPDRTKAHPVIGGEEKVPLQATILLQDQSLSASFPLE